MSIVFVGKKYSRATEGDRQITVPAHCSRPWRKGIPTMWYRTHEIMYKMNTNVLVHSMW